MTYRISNTNSLRTFTAATGGSELYRFLGRETQSSPCWHMNMTNASTIYPDTSCRSQLSTEILPSAVSRDLVSLSDMPVIPNERHHITYQRENSFASRLPVKANPCGCVADGPPPSHSPFFLTAMFPYASSSEPWPVIMRILVLPVNWNGNRMLSVLCVIVQYPECGGTKGLKEDARGAQFP